jgi:hypothetical protein
MIKSYILGSHNKPEAAVHTGAIMLTGPREEEEEVLHLPTKHVCFMFKNRVFWNEIVK